MSKAVVVRNRKLRKRVGNEARQRSRGRENHADTRVFFLSQKTQTRQRDGFRFFGCVSADNKRATGRTNRGTLHFRLAEKAAAGFVCHGPNWYRFTQRFFP